MNKTQTSGWSDDREGRKMDKWTYGHKDGLTGGRQTNKDGRTDIWTYSEGRTEGRVGRRANRLTDANRLTAKQKERKRETDIDRNRNIHTDTNTDISCQTDGLTGR